MQEHGAPAAEPNLLLRVQANPPGVAIEDEQQIPERYKHTEIAVKLLRSEIARALKAEEGMPGARPYGRFSNISSWRSKPVVSVSMYTISIVKRVLSSYSVFLAGFLSLAPAMPLMIAVCSLTWVLSASSSPMSLLFSTAER